MRSRGAAMLCPLALAGLLRGGCSSHESLEAQTFVILVEARGSDHNPVEGLEIRDSTNTRALARTDSDGRALFKTTGREGESAEFLAQPPPGSLISEGGERRQVLLRRLRSLRDDSSKLDIVSHEIRLRKRKLPYLVMLATNQVFDLPVEVFGVEKTRLNSRGVGLFSYEGLPNDEISVSILTGTTPQLRPVSPRRTFVLPDTPQILFWREDFEVQPLPVRGKLQQHVRSKKIPQPI